MGRVEREGVGGGVGGGGGGGGGGLGFPLTDMAGVLLLMWLSLFALSFAKDPSVCRAVESPMFGGLFCKRDLIMTHTHKKSESPTQAQHIHAHISTHTHTHTLAQKHTHTHTHTHMHTHTHAYIHICRSLRVNGSASKRAS